MQTIPVVKIGVLMIALDLRGHVTDFYDYETTVVKAIVNDLRVFK